MTAENSIRLTHRRFTVVVCAVAATLGLLIGSGSFRSYDVWWHLQLGQDILQSGHIVAYDEYSHTAYGNFRPPQQWLFEVAQALVYSVAGDAGLIWMRAVIAAVTFGLLAWLLLRRRCSYLAVMLAVLLIGGVSLLNIQCRPHILLPLLLMALFVILENSDARPWLLLLVAPLFGLWANIHASFTLGFVVIGIWTLHMALGGSEHIEDGIHVSPKALVIGLGTGLLALVSCIANPVGLRLLMYCVGFLPGGDYGWATVAVREWLAPDLFGVQSLPLIITVFGGALILAVRVGKTSLFQMLLGIFAVALGLRWVRGGLAASFLMMWAVTPVLSRWFDEVGMELLGYAPGMTEAPKREVSAAIAIITAIVMLSGSIGLSPRGLQVHEEHAMKFPVAAVDWVREHRPAGKMINTYHWGGYLIHRLHPDYSVFIDGRAEMYGQKVFEDFLKINRCDAGWEQLLGKYNVNWALLETGSKLADTMEATPSWDVAYRDSVATVLLRRDVEPTKNTGAAPPQAYTEQP